MKVDQSFSELASVESSKKEAVMSLAVVAVYALLTVTVMYFIPESERIRGVYTSSNFMNQMVLIGIAAFFFICILKISKQSASIVGVSRQNLLPSLGFGLPVGMVIVLLYGKIPNIANGISLSELYLFVSFMSVGFLECLIFRGFLQTRLVRWLGTSRGILLAAAVFSISHLPGKIIIEHAMIFDIFANLFGTFIMGLVFGIIYHKSKNIVAPAIVHGFNDWALNLTIRGLL